MSLRGLRAEFARLKARAERRDAPTSEDYFAATRRERARRIRGALGRLARLPSLDGSTTSHPGHAREPLADDTPERAEADRRTVEKWERAHGTPDIKGAADEARARLLDMRPR